MMDEQLKLVNMLYEANNELKELRLEKAQLVMSLNNAQHELETGSKSRVKVKEQAYIDRIKELKEENDKLKAKKRGSK